MCVHASLCNGHLAIGQQMEYSTDWVVTVMSDTMQLHMPKEVFTPTMSVDVLLLHYSHFHLWPDFETIRV